MGWLVFTWHLDVEVQETVKPQSQVFSIADINASHSSFNLVQEKAASFRLSAIPRPHTPCVTAMHVFNSSKIIQLDLLLL